MGRIERKNEVEYTGDFTAGDGEEVPVLDLTESSYFMMARSGASIEPVYDYHGLKDIVEYEKFMQEPLVIQLHTSNDPNAYPWVPLGINGEEKWIPRGIPVRLRRKFVERLAQAQSTTYKTVENADKASDSGFVERRTTGHDFPFDVIHDPNKLGRRWLQRMQKQGCGAGR